MDGGVWWATVHGVAESRTWLSDFTFTFHSYALEKEMATHSSVLALRIPGIGEPGGLPSMGSHRVGHDWRDLAAAAAGRGSSMSASRCMKQVIFVISSLVLQCKAWGREWWERLRILDLVLLGPVEAMALYSYVQELPVYGKKCRALLWYVCF